MKSLRIWFACITGVSIGTLFGWSNTLFTALMPVFVLVSQDRWNKTVFFQLISGVIWVSVQTKLIIGFLQPYPGPMFFAVALLMLTKCVAMQYKPTYLFGYIGLLIGSILLNFGSYAYFDLTDFIIGVWISAFMTIPICAMAFYLFPEPVNRNPVQPTAKPVQEPKETILQTALGWIGTMVIFLIFQLSSLNDSLSAQASMLMILAPMTLSGARYVAKVRIIGTLAGAIAAMIIQLLLYSFYDNVALYLLTYTITAGVFCRWLAEDAYQSGIGFAAISALTVPLTNNMIPGKQDAFFAILYRSSSIMVAVIAIAIILWLSEQLLKGKQNRYTLIT